MLKDMTLTSVADTFLFRPLGFADAVGQPLLVVHGDADESVPLDHGRWIFDRAKGPKDMRVLPAAPHCCWETPHEPAVFRPILSGCASGWRDPATRCVADDAP